MRTPTPVDNMMEAMTMISKDKASGGNYLQSIKEISSFIDAIEAGDETLQKSAGKNLVPLYTMRAKAHYEKGLRTRDFHEFEAARRDAGRAAEISQSLYPFIDDARKRQFQEGIDNALSPDPQKRAEGIDVILHLTGENQGILAQRVSQQPASPVHPVVKGIGSFLLGLVAWGLALFLAYQLGSLGLVIGGLGGLVLIYAGAIWGWGWLSDQYARGAWVPAVKLALFVVILITVVGLLPVMYWSGRGILRWSAARR